MLQRVAGFVLDQLSALVDDAQAMAREWLRDLGRYVQELSAKLVALLSEIAELSARLEEQTDEMLAQASDMLRFLNHSSRRNQLRSEVKVSCSGMPARR